MKKRATPLLLVIAAVLTQPLCGQGTFQNLDFESATIPQTQPAGPVDIASALPGWNAYVATNRQTGVFYNEISVGSARISLLGTNAGFGFGSIEGGFSLLLQAGVANGPGGVLVQADVSISQSGVVPATAESIRFKAQPGLGTLAVSLAGLDLPFFPLTTGTNYTLYGADVSALAGQTAELRFVAVAPLPNNWNLDSIVFSNQPIPEPSALGLSALGAMLLVWRLWHKRR